MFLPIGVEGVVGDDGEARAFCPTRSSREEEAVAR
jgi:hypothetical protein